MAKKNVKFMLTAFRDGFQSVVGARVLSKDFLPCVEEAYDAGIRWFEAGGGARFQSCYFYCQEDAFDVMGLDHQLHRDVPRGYREALDDLLGWGFLRMEDGTIRITDEGLRQVESVTGSMEGSDVSVFAASAREFADGGRTTSRRIVE